ncbi:MAG: VWA domain-containing protein [bacterium]|nr:VWA domain-containing protein [bacterium]
MIRWGYPQFFYLLLLLPILGVFLFIIKRRKNRQLRDAFASSTLLAMIAPGISFTRQSLKDVLLLVALLFMIIALADPQVGTRIEQIKREGIDLVIAVDVSYSMLAKDIAPSRLEKAKHEIRSLLDRLQGDRVALVAFSGKAIVECPLTLDYGAAEIFLDVIDPTLISMPGTSLAAAIRTSLKAFAEDSPASKAMVLITDGEDHEQQVDEAIKEAKAKGVIIHAVGIGSVQGVPIPAGDLGGDFKKDRQGNVVVTKLDEAILQQIVSETGGVYQRCSSSEDELKAITNAIAGLEKGELGSKQFTQYEHRYQPFLVAALILLVLEFLTSDRRRRLPRFLRILFAEEQK